MSTRKVPPPPPDAALSPFEVGAYLAGHVPDYVVHSFQIGGKTQSERIEAHRRYLLPDAFAAWLETEDAKRTDVDPLRVIECSGFGGAMSIEQHEEAFAQIGKPLGIQAAHREAVKVLRTVKATTAKKVAALPVARKERADHAAERREQVLEVALEILGDLKKRKPSVHELAGLVAELFPRRDGWKPGDWTPSQKAASHLLADARGTELKGKIKPPQNRSRD